jgi:hypothetical protein
MQPHGEAATEFTQENDREEEGMRVDDIYPATRSRRKGTRQGWG